MTRAQRIGAIAVGAVVAAVLVAAHLRLPMNGSWTLNRVLHYVWLAATGLAGAGGVVFFLWPRAKLQRRDQERKRARDRILSVIAVVVSTFALVAFGEVRRDRVTHAYLAPAEEDLAAIHAALEVYKADHHGALPAKLADLVPKYLSGDHLYYTFRHGPVASPKPADVQAASEEPSYVLMPKITGPAAEKYGPAENPYLVFQRPGESWAALVVALGRNGRTGLIGDDDAVRTLEGKSRRGR
jgi:hypothetical protein